MEPLEIAARAVVLGGLATALMDLWAPVQARLFQSPGLDYALVGRWILHMRRGRFAHPAIRQAEPAPGERLVGWAAHYAIGVAFATLLLLAVPGWAQRPTAAPALAVGLASLAAPFLVMQPAFGLGVAASRTPKPHIARLRSLLTHLVFGAGLYLAGLAARAVWPS